MRRFLPILALLAIPRFAAADGPTPETRAKELVTKQVNALADSADAFAATLAPEAIVIYPRHETVLVKDGIGYIDQELLGGSPHSNITKAKVKKVVVGGNAQAIVIVAELALGYYAVEPEFGSSRGTDIVHMTELYVEDGGAWKVVAIALEPADITDYGEEESIWPIPNATEAGGLTPLLAQPPALLAALGSDKSVSVLGTGKGERAFGLAKAKKLLAGWKKLELHIDGKPHEVTTKTYGFTVANVNLISRKKSEYPIRLRGLLVAFPDATGTWKVAAVEYVSR
jgi:hypothetical protein